MSDTSANMSSSSNTLAHDKSAKLADYIALLKPRVMSLVVFSSLVGLMLAPGDIHYMQAVGAIFAIALGAGASGALNMWYDADIDAQMQRTMARPIPAGKIARDHVLVIGIVLSAVSVLILGLITNWFAAFLLALTIFYYLFIYTIWLKRRTPQNIVIGGAAGAFPPMIGWAAVTGNASLESFSLFILIFMWTPPHFWALALNRYRDYKRVNIPMMPVVKGPDATRRMILIYSALLVPLSFLPVLLNIAGVLYAVIAAFFGAGFFLFAWQVYWLRFGRMGERAARRLFGFSIFYLFILLAALLAERLLAAIGYETLINI